MRFRPKFLIGWTPLLMVAAELTARAAEEGVEGGFPGEFAFKWIHFAIVFGVLGYFAWKYAPGFFAARAGTIRRELEEASRAFEESRARLTGIEQHLEQIDQEIERLSEEATQELAAERERIHAAGQIEAEKILAAARMEIEATTRAATAEMKAYAARLAVQLAAAQIREQMTPARQARTVERFVKGLEGVGRS